MTLRQIWQRLRTPVLIGPYHELKRPKFQVDEKGKARLLRWNESKDGDYNRKIKAMLEDFRFRPAVRPDGTPVRDTAVVTGEVPGDS